MKSKYLILLSLIPLSEIKSIFYNSDIRVSWYLFSDNKRYLCNVLEDYSNTISFCIVFWYLYEAYKTKIIGQIALFLFFLSSLDIIHLGLNDMQGFIIIKLFLAYIMYRIWFRLKHG